MNSLATNVGAGPFPTFRRLPVAFVPARWPVRASVPFLKRQHKQQEQLQNTERTKTTSWAPAPIRNNASDPHRSDTQPPLSANLPATIFPSKPQSSHRPYHALTLYPFHATHLREVCHTSPRSPPHISEKSTTFLRAVCHSPPSTLPFCYSRCRVTDCCYTLGF